MPAFSWKSSIGTTAEIHTLTSEYIEELTISNDGSNNVHFTFGSHLAKTSDPEILPGESISLRNVGFSPNFSAIAATSATTIRIFGSYTVRE